MPVQIRTNEQDGPDDLDLPTQLRRMQQNLVKLRPDAAILHPFAGQPSRCRNKSGAFAYPTGAVFDVTLKSAGYLSGVPGGKRVACT